MKITAGVVPARSAPFEIATLELAPPLADRVRAVAAPMPDAASEMRATFAASLMASFLLPP